MARVIITVTVFVLLAALIVVLDWGEVSKIIGEAEWELTLAALLFSIISYSCLSFGYVLRPNLFTSLKRRWSMANLRLELII